MEYQFHLDDPFLCFVWKFLDKSTFINFYLTNRYTYIIALALGGRSEQRFFLNFLCILIPMLLLPLHKNSLNLSYVLGTKMVAVFPPKTLTNLDLAERYWWNWFHLGQTSQIIPTLKYCNHNHPLSKIYFTLFCKHSSYWSRNISGTEIKEMAFHHPFINFCSFGT